MAKIVEFMSNEQKEQEKLRDLLEELDKADDKAISIVLQRKLRSDNGLENTEKSFMEWAAAMVELKEASRQVREQKIKMGLIDPDNPDTEKDHKWRFSETED
ncbi:MAG: hypothetical protein K6B72_05160 [Lachnospiraceae bacterium]|nr:hypothetical protein [Lachnospiraceae bacterium]